MTAGRAVAGAVGQPERGDLAVQLAAGLLLFAGQKAARVEVAQDGGDALELGEDGAAFGRERVIGGQHHAVSCVRGWLLPRG